MYIFQNPICLLVKTLTKQMFQKNWSEYISDTHNLKSRLKIIYIEGLKAQTPVWKQSSGWGCLMKQFDHAPELTHQGIVFMLQVVIWRGYDKFKLVKTTFLVISSGVTN